MSTARHHARIESIETKTRYRRVLESKKGILARKEPYNAFEKVLHSNRGVSGLAACDRVSRSTLGCARRNRFKVYKAVEPLPKSTTEVPVGETSQGGDFHADRNLFQANLDSKADEDAAFEAEMAAYDAEAAQLDAEYEARAKRMKEKAAYIAKLEAEKAERIALEEELGELITWGEGFSRKVFLFMRIRYCL